MLQLEKVGKTVGRDVHVADVDLRLERGSLNVLLGPTLSGKTTLMRLMAGLDRPTEGRILMDGQDVTGVPVAKRNVAMVYQQFINYPAMTVRENIASPLRVAGKPSAKIEEAVARAAKLMKLEPYLDRTPLNLSGGQQQRTALARAIVKGADLVLLDEPLANLDYKLREELREELPRIFAASGAIFVYATTEPTEALLLGGNTATLREGRITQFGPTPAVYRTPADLATARIVSDPPLNVLPFEVQNGGVTGSNGLTLPQGFGTGLAPGRYQLGIRAHKLRLGDTEPAAGTLAAAVLTSEVTGSQTFVHADGGGARLVALLPGVRRVERGEALRFTFDLASLLVFDADGRRVDHSTLPLAA
ncbi:ABC transporter ATP-binding protein [Aureimonas jatrophae]|uniref:Carbohydrate ABC transporter ATP-binding protein, CUT1 family n=1 Tax=Aureimonas jatrophae TaxID=1166073 RepID=A0A1H0JIK9_9HYPH|nr:ABC transporter ATP-binding protein [Aureimonas jatrophae]MBB3951406.1 glycerol transport system ATP-binding protein [Aureimonas jatrophae]SDO43201.1 carbohydrate ABC transporter ATP-binding protein, CUT1 family [Aureimonas jatrophae]